MRAFFVLVIFFLAILLFASTSLANVDLTPDTPQAAQAVAPANPPVIIIQENQTLPTPGTPIVPVTGACANPYIVQPADWLSKIAIKCNTSLAAILQANPQITNADLIYPDQRITLPNGTAIVPVTGGCANPYIVQPGDWLIKIAANCNSTLAVILQDNPQIANQNLIYPDQRITLPNASAAAPLPLTGFFGTAIQMIVRSTQVS